MTLLFSRKSPKLMRASPRSSILVTLSCNSSASATLFTFLTEPSSNMTVGPSSESTNAMVAALPGVSTFTCVPATTGSSSNVAIAGCIPMVDSPVFIVRAVPDPEPTFGVVSGEHGAAGDHLFEVGARLLGLVRGFLFPSFELGKPLPPGYVELLQDL